MRNYWTISAGVSLALHAAIIVELPNMRLFNKSEIAPTKQEITFNPEKIEKLTKKPTNLKEMDPPPFIENKLLSNIVSPDNQVASLPKQKTTQTTIHKITLANELPDEELKSIPAYVDYYQIIRDKIRQHAYYYYNSSRQGEITLNFTILSNGRLDGLSLKPSTASTLLHRIATKSIQDSAPFPPFPKELKEYAQLQFNISIFFKNN